MRLNRTLLYTGVFVLASAPGSRWRTLDSSRRPR